jgi:DNA-binding NarL/FixJ family response regulator
MMGKEIRVAIIEEDPYALEWISLILARDWRTKVVGGYSSLCQFLASEKNNLTPVDSLLVDSDVLRKHLSQVTAVGKDLKRPIHKIALGDRFDQDVLDQCMRGGFSGYLQKYEIGNSLAWALDFASNDAFVVTPSSERSVYSASGATLASEIICLDGRKPIANLTNHDLEVARMALIFSMERRELSAELGVSEDWGYGLVHTVYQKLGLEEFFSGEVDPAEYFGQNQILHDRFQEIVSRVEKSKKAKDMEALAFHLLTMPDVIYHREFGTTRKKVL